MKIKLETGEIIDPAQDNVETLSSEKLEMVANTIFLFIATIVGNQDAIEQAIHDGADTGAIHYDEIFPDGITIIDVVKIIEPPEAETHSESEWQEYREELMKLMHLPANAQNTNKILPIKLDREVLDVLAASQLNQFYESFLKNRINLFNINSNGFDNLHLALMNKQNEIAKKLIEKCSELNINQQGPDGNSYLHLAQYDIGLIQKLLDKGINANLQNKELETTLAVHLSQGRLSTDLYQGGINDEIAKLLIEHTDITLKDKHGNSLLHTTNYMPIVKILLDSNLIPVDAKNIYYGTPLINAGFADNIAKTLMLLQNGADTEVEMYGGRSLLSYKLHTMSSYLYPKHPNKNVDLVKILIAYGSKINQKALDHFIEIAKENAHYWPYAETVLKSKIIKDILSKKCSNLPLDKKDMSELHYKIINDSVDAVQLASDQSSLTDDSFRALDDTINTHVTQLVTQCEGREGRILVSEENMPNDNQDGNCANHDPIQEISNAITEADVPLNGISNHSDPMDIS